MRKLIEECNKPTLQDLVDLTPEQHRAWRRMERAVKDFRAAGGRFYCVLDSMSGYNGDCIAGIDNDGTYHTQNVSMPTIDAPGLTSFADDWHGIVLKPGVVIAD
ncbi:hypothetical protein D8682_00370 (plasmid) [Buttiauxella sp. 3AFRM03]|uniref:hypothetical protein n=1 Tax=Buttiauxella sp. 3AFRM03 TaxID=2479367 RepID=UPI000EF83764|nr:hypothetical protein [Buttiauxella sp. 3AFRM03]AYN25568.1 hypothetical protein D8682_00370 [Buttiauxella sp. 3AFRM03]